jgi:hypothetical protein
MSFDLISNQLREDFSGFLFVGSRCADDDKCSVANELIGCSANRQNPHHILCMINELPARLSTCGILITEGESALGKLHQSFMSGRNSITRGGLGPEREKGERKCHRCDVGQMSEVFNYACKHQSRPDTGAKFALPIAGKID